MAEKAIPPVIIIIIGSIVLAVSLIMTAKTKSNFILFSFVGGVMVVYGVARFVLNKGRKENPKKGKSVQIHARQRDPIHQHNRQLQQHVVQQANQPVKFCSHCGARVQIHAKFCQNCGAPL